MINDMNKAQAVSSAPCSEQEDNKENVSNGSAPRTMMVGDTTVRLSFSDSGSLSTRLASAFNSMLR